MHKYLKEKVSTSVNKGRNDFSQLFVIALSALIGYLLLDHNPGEEFLDWDLIIRESFISVVVVIVLLYLTYLLQKYVAKSLRARIDYEFWPWGILATIFVLLMNAGTFVFYMPGIFWLNKTRAGFANRLPEVSRVESAAVAGVGPSLGLLLALITLQSPIISITSATYAVWSLLPIPKTNGFHYFNWHPLHAGFNGILSLVLLAMYVITGISVFLVIITLLFLCYQWFYVYVIARRTGY